MELNLEKSAIAARKRVAEELGISLEALLLLGVEHVLLHILDKPESSWPTDFIETLSQEEKL